MSLRILFVSRTWSPEIGGIQTYLSSVLSHLEGKAEVRTAIIRIKGALVIPALPFFVLFIMARTLRWKPDVVYFGNAILGPVAWFISRFLKYPVVTTVYGLELVYPNKLFRALFDIAIRKFSFVIAISRWTGYLASRLGVNKNKIQIIRPGVGYRKPYPKSICRSGITKDLHSPLLLSVGRLIPRKGVYWFIQNAFPEVLKRHPTAVYVVVGTGPEIRRIQSYVRKYNLHKAIRLLGRIKESDLLQIYSCADLFLMPNIPILGDSEGFGLVLVEASAMGLPVIASRLQGIPDAVVENETGILVTPNDRVGFINAIERLLEDEWQTESRKKSIIRMTRRTYSWDRVAEEYLSLFRKLAS